MLKIEYVSYYDSPVGTLQIITDGEFLTHICITNRKLRTDYHKLNLEVGEQLNAYFQGRLKRFDLPIKFNFEGFRLKVLNAINEIPYGATVSYADIASMAGSPKAYRSAGSAAKKNPIPIVVPCHRVVAAHGIGGFSLGLEKKRYLLDLERREPSHLIDFQCGD